MAIDYGATGDFQKMGALIEVYFLIKKTHADEVQAELSTIQNLFKNTDDQRAVFKDLTAHLHSHMSSQASAATSVKSRFESLLKSEIKKNLNSAETAVASIIEDLKEDMTENSKEVDGNFVGHGLIGSEDYSQVGEHTPPAFSTTSMTFTLNARDTDGIKLLGGTDYYVQIYLYDGTGSQWVTGEKSGGVPYFGLITGLASADKLGQYQMVCIDISGGNGLNDVTEGSGYYFKVTDASNNVIYIGANGLQYTSEGNAQSNTIAYGGSKLPDYVADSDNTGNGTVGSISVNQMSKDKELFTIECTNADTAGSETWSVKGESHLSGAAKSSATTGVAFSEADYSLAFTITAGGTNFAVGDKFYINTQSTEEGTFQRFFRDALKKSLPYKTDGTEDISDLLAE